ncbi:DUF2256 domain-containing protein [Brevundimonas sp. NPDC092305]|uniref:DUF2256 domain-containing protein n=1 Tax=Brevundimonas sp. NPDC092305 TaxID=3363957 RepID=UPI0038235231
MSRKHVNAAGTAKRDLPQKTCASCGKPFSWRRKWARDWASVLYCSDKCRTSGKTP